MTFQNQTDGADPLRVVRTRLGGLLPILAAAIVLVGTPIREVSAQPPGQNRNQVGDTLEQARALYEELLPLARRIGDEGILGRLGLLREQWVAADGHYRAGRTEQAGVLARRNFDSLRQLAVQIRRLAQRLPYYGRMEERNRELLQFMREGLGSDAPPEVMRQLTLASGAYQRALQTRQQGNLLQAFRLMEQCESMIRQVLRSMDRTGMTPEAVRRELDDTARRIERLENTPDLVEIARQALTQAREAQQEAERFFSAGDLRRALTGTLTARNAVRLASRLTVGALAPEDVAAAIAHVEELRELHAALAGSTDPQVRRLWDEAGQHLARAREHLDRGELRPGLAEAQTAAKLVLTAARRADGGTPPPLPDDA